MSEPLAGKPPDVLLSMPCYDSYKRDMVHSVFNLVSYSASAGLVIEPHFCGGSSVAINRVDAVYRAKESSAVWLFFMDSDMCVPHDALEKMIARDKDIVSGVYTGKVRPFPPIASRYVEPDNPNSVFLPILDVPTDGSLVEVDAAGGGCLLIRASIFDYLTEPYFSFEPIEGRKYPFGEDYYFCRKAKKAGYKVWLDTSVMCGHIGDLTYTINHYDAAKGAVQPKIVKPKGGLILAN